MADLMSKLALGNFALAFGSGIYHGYHNSLGIEPPPLSFEASTLYLPSLIMGGLFATQSKMMKNKTDKSKPLNEQHDIPAPGTIRFALSGTARAGIATAIGWGIGYSYGYTCCRCG